LLSNLIEHHLIFDLVGGKQTFENLVESFYAKIEVDHLLRPLFPPNLDAGKHLQALFLAQKFGGPRDYEKLRGHAKLRQRHSKFPIGIIERNRWVELMLQTLKAVGVNESHKAWPTLKLYFEEIAKSDISGFILTYVWALEDERDTEYMKQTIDIFKKQLGEIFLVELEADQSIRIQRNKEESRLVAKSSKRDLVMSEKILLNIDENHVLNTNDENSIPLDELYLKINNSNLSAGEAADIIIKHFNFNSKE